MWNLAPIYRNYHNYHLLTRINILINFFVIVSLAYLQTPSVKPTKYHFYPHNQHIYLLPECAIQQVNNVMRMKTDRHTWHITHCHCGLDVDVQRENASHLTIIPYTYIKYFIRRNNIYIKKKIVNSILMLWWERIDFIGCQPTKYELNAEINTI